MCDFEMTLVAEDFIKYMVTNAKGNKPKGKFNCLHIDSITFCDCSIPKS